MKVRKQYTCPLEIVHDIIKGKWKTILIFQMREEPCSFSRLLHKIDGISPKMLLEQLKELREFGLIDKCTYEGYPLKVEYFLTTEGQKILSAICIMQEVGKEYILKQHISKECK